MKTVSRRDMLKTGLLVPAAAAVHGIGPLGTTIEAAAEGPGTLPLSAVNESSGQNGGSGAGERRDAVSDYREGSRGPDLQAAAAGRILAMIGAMFWTIDGDLDESYAFSNVVWPQLHGYPNKSVQHREKPAD